MTKLVFIVYSELNQRWVDYLCLDEMANHFDVEYWDCSDFVEPGFHFEQKMSRPFLVKIHDLKELKHRLRDLPKESIVNPLIQYTKGSYKCHKYIAKYFPVVLRTYFFQNDTPSTSKSTSFFKAQEHGIKYVLKKMRQFLYKSPSFAYIIKNIFHPNPSHWKQNQISYYSTLSHQVYKKIYTIGCQNWNDYIINAPDVERFVSMSKEVMYKERYVVYIDQYFPYHKELTIFHDAIDPDQMAPIFYQSINRFFDRIERDFNCKVVIAAHPMADYTKNPFGGRKLIINKTPELIRDSLAVCMQTSNSIAYVALFRKPVLIFTGNVFRLSASIDSALHTISSMWQLPLIDMDALPQHIEFGIFSEEKRQEYIERFYGNINEGTIVPNAELFVKYYTDFGKQVQYLR